MGNLCIIPARGGSKRIPRKNIKTFCGKPIIAYSIEAAIKSNLFDEVMVSTDDDEIAELALKYGASVPFLRSEKTANDFATTFDVIEEVLENFKNRKELFDYTCCIYACAPFVSEDNLKLSFNQLIEKRFDTVLPIIPFGYPIQRSLKIKDNNIGFIYPEYSLTRSQDLEQIYHDASQFYWLNTKICLEKKHLITDNSGSIILSELEGQDIDNDIDWKLAELKYKLLQGHK
jgi:pseudaminic acid cytidylyltransferase